MFTEQVSARIVQEVTAEAVAVLKGEQETQRLPSGKTRDANNRLVHQSLVD